MQTPKDRLATLLDFANRFQMRHKGDLLTAMREAEYHQPCKENAIMWALLPEVYRTIVAARVQQKAPGEEALQKAILWFAAAWGTVDWGAPKAEECRTLWPAAIPHPFGRWPRRKHPTPNEEAS